MVILGYFRLLLLVGQSLAVCSKDSLHFAGKWFDSRATLARWKRACPVDGRETPS